MCSFSEKPPILRVQNKTVRPGATVQCLGQSHATNLQNVIVLNKATIICVAFMQKMQRTHCVTNLISF